MAKWSTKYNRDSISVNFLCISVEGENVGRYFFNFTGDCINGTLLPDERVPFPAQLGCSGFIIIDSNGLIVTTASSPTFLDAGDGAFLSVEESLNALLPKSEGNSILQKSNTIAATTTMVACESNIFGGEIALKPLPYVGVCDMDAEHHEIDESLRKLVESPSITTLGELKQVVTHHFEHEEDYLRESNFGLSSNANGISAMASHVGDHQRILNVIDGILLSEKIISQNDIAKVANIIYTHGERFDELYAQKVECQSCKRSAF